MKTTFGTQFIKGLTLAFIIIAMWPAVTRATAPRFAPEWFTRGEKPRPIVVAHEYPPYRSISLDGNGLHVQIVRAAFLRSGMDVAVNVQPAKSLMIYALMHEKPLAVVGEKADFSGISKESLLFVPFHVKTGRYYQYRPLHDKPLAWNGTLADIKGLVLGLETAADAATCEKAGATVVVDHLPDLLAGLRAGEIDVVAADAQRVLQVIGTHYPENRNDFVAMKTPAWESFSFAVFNREHQNGRLTADRFAHALKQMLRDGGYDLILKNSGGTPGLSPSQREKLEKSLDSFLVAH